MSGPSIIPDKQEEEKSQSGSANELTGREQAGFCSQLSVLLQAGVPLVRALTVLELQADRPSLKNVITELKRQVQTGKSLASGMRQNGASFDPLISVTVEVGEETGRLPSVLAQLGEYLERMNALRRKILQAMAYPALVVSVALLAVLFLLLFIVPAFADMFKSFQVELPDSTKFVLQVSEVISEYWHLLLLSLIAFIIAIRWVSNRPTIASKMVDLTTSVPVFGSVYGKVLTARFCRTLGTLLEARVTLVEALAVTMKIFQNSSLQKEISKLDMEIRQGGAIGDRMAESAWFPPMVSQMIAVGEETGELPAMLLKVASFYEKEINESVDTLTSVIEPVIVVLLGILVAGILVTMYLPLFDLVGLSDIR